MCLKTPARAFLCLALTLFCFSAYAAPMLNGLAIHQELGEEQFIGALYSETLSNDPDTLINSNLPMRMELKIVAPEGLTTRRFSRMWIEGMAINNNNTLLTAQADNMVKFDGLFKGRLMQNDHLVFTLNPGAGVNISINSVPLGNIADDQFFSMLLRTWIGRVPLSSNYREDLLKVGDVPGGLRSRFESITYTSARVSEINTWNKPVAEPAQVVAAAPAREAPQPEPAKPEPAVSAPPVSMPPIAKVELPELERPDASTPREETVPAPAPVEQPAPAVAAPVADTQYEDNEDDQPALTAQVLLARQFYGSDILKKIRSNVRYPRISIERNQEGSMRIAIVVNRDGSIASMSWLEESKYDRLNREAWDAVQRAAPFSPIPAELTGRTFEFTAPISFEMAK